MPNYCFLCDTTVTVDTDERTREKYRYAVGINDSAQHTLDSWHRWGPTCRCPPWFAPWWPARCLRPPWPLNINLPRASHLCYLCCHVLNKLSLFKSICLQRGNEYPDAMGKKYPITLQKSDIEIHILGPDKFYEYNHTDDSNDTTDPQFATDSLYVHNDAEFFNNAVNNDINSDTEVTDTERTVVDESNCDVKTPHHSSNHKINYDEMNIETDNNGLSYTDLNEHDTENDNHINNLNNQRNSLIDDAIENGDMKIDSENIPSTNKNDFDNTEQVDHDNGSKTEEIADENSTTEKKTKKKSDKGFKKIVLSLEKQKAELEANRKKKKYIEAEFRCYNCALSFLFKDTYQAHMMRHEESNGEYQCVTCTLRFATPALLRIHAACHTERHLCRKCGECLKPRVKRRHACYQPLQTQSVACHLCGNLLKDANGLQQHLKRVHANKASGRRYACHVCGDSYARQGALRTHMIKHINRKFPCDQCDGTYSSPYTLTQHKRTHHAGGELHHCATCGASYATRKSLLAHMRNTSNHTTTTFECPICSRVCPNQKSLASHIQCVHSTRKDFTCSLCPARYSNRKSLVRHVVAHNKQKPVRVVVCHLCGTNFKDNSKLNRHLREVCKKSKEEQLLAMYD